MLDTLSEITNLLYGLALTGGAFLLWERSRPAALFGAAAGATTLFFQLVFWILHAILTGPRSPEVRVAFTMMSGVGNLAHYALLVALVIALGRARAKEETR